MLILSLRLDLNAIPEKMNSLPLLAGGRNIAGVTAKSVTSREKLNDLLANTSMPSNNLKRAIFVCSLRTPKENQNTFPKIGERSSMVGRNGQSLAIGCFPVKAVSHPVTFYRQTVRSTAVDSENYLLESITMQNQAKSKALYTLKVYTNAGELFFKAKTNTYDEARSAVDRLKELCPEYDLGMFKIQRLQGLNSAMGGAE